jgi:hypothetical protein
MEGRPRVLTSAPSSGGGMSTGAVVVPLVALLVGVVIGLVVGGDGDEESDAGPGPSQSEAGIPEGFEQSEDGAVAAATRYAEAFDVEVLVDPDRAEELLAEIATPQFAEETLANVEQAQDAPAGGELQEASGRGGALGQTVPLSYRVESYTEDSAIIAIWAMSITGGGAVQPQARFDVVRLTLAWDEGEGDWKLAAYDSVSEGPTPALDRSENRAPTPAAAFLDEIVDFEEVRSAPR